MFGGELIYVSRTRLNIGYVVSIISQFMHSPTERHLEVAYHILRYLNGTPGKGMLFKKSKDRGIRSFADVDWARSIENSKSISRYCTKLWENLVTWRNKKQVVSCNSAKAEYRAIA